MLRHQGGESCDLLRLFNTCIETEQVRFLLLLLFYVHGKHLRSHLRLYRDGQLT